jgi:hypothetical protein
MFESEFRCQMQHGRNEQNKTVASFQFSFFLLAGAYALFLRCACSSSPTTVLFHSHVLCTLSNRCSSTPALIVRSPRRFCLWREEAHFFRVSAFTKMSSVQSLAPVYAIFGPVRKGGGCSGGRDLLSRAMKLATYVPLPAKLEHLARISIRNHSDSTMHHVAIFLITAGPLIAVAEG